MGSPLLCTIVALAAPALGAGCAAAPPASSQAQAAASAGLSLPAGPRIAGTVTFTPETTRKGAGVVYLEDAPKAPGVAAKVEVDVKNKEFAPFIAVVTSGGTVTFANRDALTHHVFSPDLPGWDTGYLRKDDSVSRRFDAPGPVALLCNIHPEMIGYLLVIPSTLFGSLGPDGKYAIANVPPGTYRATAWSPRTPTVTQSVTVGASGSVTANFELHAASPPN